MNSQRETSNAASNERADDLSEISSLVARKVEKIVLQKYDTILLAASLLLMFIAYSAGHWIITYNHNRLQAGELHFHRGMMIALAENLESLRGENIAEIRLMSNAFDEYLSILRNIGQENRNCALLPFSNLGHVVETPIDELIEQPIDAAVETYR